MADSLETTRPETETESNYCNQNNDRMEQTN